MLGDDFSYVVNPNDGVIDSNVYFDEGIDKDALQGDLKAGFNVGMFKYKEDPRKEGYYYQPHYRVPMYEFGDIIQGGHFDISVNKVQPVQRDGLYIAVTSKVKHDCALGNVIYVCDDLTDKVYKSEVVYVKSKLTFYMNVIEGFNWVDMCQMINEGRLQLRRNNRDIPIYATKVGKNTYIWREILKPGDEKTQELEEYIFSNKSFYINKDINFYLRRKDPNGLYGLQTKESDYVIPDVSGTKLDNNIIDTYVEEDEAEC
jgi:hypothetical protein